ncbi:hypothetical protein JXM83_00440 [Candidatus Woesearchaeota archaeon]|nr:hypothetical protein [Candidatus Woesearchaeota archaeon]
MNEIYKLWPFELIGVKLGLKRVGIIYCEKQNLANLISKLEQEGFFVEVSDFFYSEINHSNVVILSNPTDKSQYSVYVGLDADIVRRFKKLDYFHQLYPTKTGKYSKIIVNEINDLLCFPKCCFDKYQNLVKNPDSFLRDNLNFEDSLKIHLLNNVFSIDYRLNYFLRPELIGYFVCDYYCKDSIDISERILNFFKENDSSYYLQLISDMKRSFIYFNSKFWISFANVRTEDSLIYYDNCDFSSNGVLSNAVFSNYKWRDICSFFKKGTSFSVEDNILIIYYDTEMIFSMPYVPFFIEVKNV